MVVGLVVSGRLAVMSAGLYRGSCIDDTGAVIASGMVDHRTGRWVFFARLGCPVLFGPLYPVCSRR